MMIKVLHNNECSKSRAVLEFLDENGVNFEVIDIIKDPLSPLEIKTLLKKLDLKASEITRTNDALFKEKFSQKERTDEEWILLLSENPSLIQRPILVRPQVAIIARPLENAKFFIEQD